MEKIIIKLTKTNEVQDALRITDKDTYVPCYVYWGRRYGKHWEEKSLNAAQIVDILQCSEYGNPMNKVFSYSKNERWCIYLALTLYERTTLMNMRQELYMQAAAFDRTGEFQKGFNCYYKQESLKNLLWWPTVTEDATSRANDLVKLGYLQPCEREKEQLRKPNYQFFKD